MLIFVKVRSRPEKADALMDDVDDERANIMAYHHEGGGEEDQVKIIESLFFFHFSEIIEHNF